MSNSVLKTKSFDFALRVVKLSQHLANEKKEFVLSKQILRYGTSIGANIEEAFQGESRADFIHKLAIANKEAFETHYRIRLLLGGGYLEKMFAASLLRTVMNCKDFSSRQSKQ